MPASDAPTDEYSALSSQERRSFAKKKTYTFSALPEVAPETTSCRFPEDVLGVHEGRTHPCSISSGTSLPSFGMPCRSSHSMLPSFGHSPDKNPQNKDKNVSDDVIIRHHSKLQRVPSSYSHMDFDEQAYTHSHSDMNQPYSPSLEEPDAGSYNDFGQEACSNNGDFCTVDPDELFQVNIFPLDSPVYRRVATIGIFGRWCCACHAT